MKNNWTTASMPELDGKVFLVTGANSGLGFGTAKALAHKGAKVVMTVRNLDKGNHAVQQIKAELPDANVDLMQLDLADLAQIAQFSAAFKDNYRQLDVLINNAGVMAPNTRQETKDGFELQFGTNHLGHFVLTAQLFEVLEKTPHSRIVVLSSLVAKMKQADIYWDDIHFTKKYDKWRTYAQSKLANMLFAKELDLRLQEQNNPVTCLMAHPGYTATNLQDNMGLLGKVMNFLIAQKLEMGILPTLRAATDANVKGGEYYGPAKMMNYRGYPILNTLNAVANDRTLTKRLWEKSEQLTGTNFFEKIYDTDN